MMSSSPTVWCIVLLASVILGLVNAGCTDVAEMCIWNADSGVKKACSSFPGLDTTTVCRKSGRYKIAFEMKAYSTEGGFGPCFEKGGIECPEILGMYIKICNVATTPPTCTEKTEKAWRYFSYGNRDSLSNANGVGTINGRAYTPGTYEITTQTITDEGCTEATLRTSTLILRSTCQGDEDFVLK